MWSNKNHSGCKYDTVDCTNCDGHVACGLDKSVEEAWNICKDFCSKNNPPLKTCDLSCSPEVAYFNYFVENKL
jgi:hypothetical protein